MKRMSKMLAGVPVAFLVAFMLFGTPAAPGTGILPDNVGDMACADTGGLCYGGHGPEWSGCCPGYYRWPATGNCISEECYEIKQEYETASGLGLFLGGWSLGMAALPGGQPASIVTGVLAFGLGTRAAYLAWAHPECFGG